MAKAKVVAVSGGVDSVVLLDQLVATKQQPLIVAHFDHGIRADSADDARFVRGLADSYGVPFAMRREELGQGASEQLARERRYHFLWEVAERYEGTIVTAHHANDVAETIAINLTRGTGWRGVAVLDSRIERPLLGVFKRELVAYAHEHQLDWREDSTNQSDAYLRNRLRPRLDDEDTVLQLAALRADQCQLKRAIDQAVAALDLQSPYARYFFVSIDQAVARECLRAITAARLTPPQLQRALLAIATQRPHSRYQAGAGVELSFTSRHFTVQMVK